MALPAGVYGRAATFNRTTMELKLVRRAQRAKGRGPFNRTTMELKQITNTLGLKIDPDF